MLTELLSYDPATGLFTWRVDVRKKSIKAGTIAGCRDPKGYIRIWSGGRFYKAHRLAWFFVYGEWPPEQIDHRNGVKDDNRITNLRLASNAQNTANKGFRSDNSTGYKGISPSGKKWRAEIVVKGRRHYLGHHATPELAHRAYRKAAIILLGEYAPPPDICRC